MIQSDNLMTIEKLARETVHRNPDKKREIERDCEVISEIQWFRSGQVRSLNEEAISWILEGFASCQSAQIVYVLWFFQRTEDCRLTLPRNRSTSAEGTELQVCSVCEKNNNNNKNNN